MRLARMKARHLILAIVMTAIVIAIFLLYLGSVSDSDMIGAEIFRENS